MLVLGCCCLVAHLPCFVLFESHCARLVFCVACVPSQPRLAPGAPLRGRRDRLKAVTGCFSVPLRVP